MLAKEPTRIQSMLQPIDDWDQKLIQDATNLLIQRGRSGFHSTGAAVWSGSGEQFVSLDLRSRKSAVCAEPGAFAAAHSAGIYDIERVVAICHVVENSKYQVISPCGSCRELIHYHCPEAQVIVEYQHGLYRVDVKRLFLFAEITGAHDPRQN